jgi:hypothetical protein
MPNLIKCIRKNCPMESIEMVHIWLHTPRNAMGYWIFGQTAKTKTQIGISKVNV